MTNAGWYNAEGDAPGTQRYWDGETWQGEPVAANIPVGSPSPPGASQVPGAPAFMPPQYPPHARGQVEKLSPFQYWKKCWTSSFADFEGRARRAEYGWFFLMNAVVGFILFLPSIIALVMMSDSEDPPALFFAGFGLVVLFMLVSFIPSLAVAVRRWHDVGQSGWFVLFRFIPVVGWLVHLFELLADSKEQPNQWGSSPKYG